MNSYLVNMVDSQTAGCNIPVQNHLQSWKVHSCPVTI